MLQTSFKHFTWWMQCTQISCNKGEMEVADCKAGETKEIDMKSRLCCCSTKKVYNGVYKVVSTITENYLNNNITKKKRKWNSVFIVHSIYMLMSQFILITHWLSTLPVVYTTQSKLCYSMISEITKHISVNTLNNAENSISKRKGSCKVLRLFTTDDSRD